MKRTFAEAMAHRQMCIRDSLKTGGLALAGLTIAPSSILGKSHGHVPPSDRLNTVSYTHLNCKL